MDKTNSIMVLGKPNSGKTVYSAQLYGRLTRGVEQQIAIRNTPENLDIFQEALERLAEGNNPQRTTSSQFANVSLPLVIKNEKEVDLTWFDYAGEQLTHIFESRSVNEKWAETLINANGWMVFIRLNDETKYKHKIEDLLTNRDVIKKGKTKQEETDSVDANIWWIELFQIILHVCNQLQTLTKIPLLGGVYAFKVLPVQTLSVRAFALPTPPRGRFCQLSLLRRNNKEDFYRR